MLSDLAQWVPGYKGGRLRSGVSGATTTEFVIIMPIFFVILFGIIETAFIFRTRSTLNTATFDAARHGAMNHALVEPMNERLVRGMMPLYMDADKDVGQYTQAYSKSQARMTAANSFGLNPVKVVSPTQSMLDELGVERSLRLPGHPYEQEFQVIPNDNLSYRPSSEVSVRIDGESRKVNVQDANILKIQTYWCHPLIVPVVGPLIEEAATNLLNATAETAACAALSQSVGGHHIPITSQATVRMQSDVVGHDLPAN
ncbi:TadE/TadG family type IV pilus assembly protein [Vreelandella utahensis]|uniref:TadE/TadG family type IV pilus assembly protein n=1 Tax=Vreelandella halophila TaxID=86177 RepID=UPI00117990CD|nr:TadE family protein [Halomonas utahensis]